MSAPTNFPKLSSSTPKTCEAFTQPGGTLKSFLIQREEDRHEGLVVVLPRDVLGIVKGYNRYIDPNGIFDREAWIKYWGVDPGEEPKLSDDLLNILEGFDPLDPSKLFCETHLELILRPKSISRNGRIHSLSLSLLKQIADEPKEGHRATFEFSAENDFHYLNERGLKTRSTCWLIVRKELIGTGTAFRGLKRMQNGMLDQYIDKPILIDLVTIMLAHHVVTGERLFRQSEPRAQSYYSRCIETEKENPRSLMITFTADKIKIRYPVSLSNKFLGLAARMQRTP